MIGGGAALGFAGGAGGCRLRMAGVEEGDGEEFMRLKSELKGWRKNSSHCGRKST